MREKVSATTGESITADFSGLRTKRTTRTSVPIPPAESWGFTGNNTRLPDPEKMRKDQRKAGEPKEVYRVRNRREYTPALIATRDVAMWIDRRILTHGSDAGPPGYGRLSTVMWRSRCPSVTSESFKARTARHRSEPAQAYLSELAKLHDLESSRAKMRPAECVETIGHRFALKEH